MKDKFVTMQANILSTYDYYSLVSIISFRFLTANDTSIVLLFSDNIE